MIASIVLLLAMASPAVDEEVVEGFFADRGRVSAVVGVIAGGIVGTTTGVVVGHVQGTNAAIADGLTERPLHESIASLPAVWGLLAGVAVGGGVGAAIGGAPIETVALTTLVSPVAVLGGAALLYFTGVLYVLIPVGLGVGLAVGAFAGVEAGTIAGLGAVAVVTAAALIGVPALTADTIVTMMRPAPPRPAPAPVVEAAPVVAPAPVVDPADVVVPAEAPVVDEPVVDPVDDHALDGAPRPEPKTPPADALR